MVGREATIAGAFFLVDCGGLFVCGQSFRPQIEIAKRTSREG